MKKIIFILILLISLSFISGLSLIPPESDRNYCTILGYEADIVNDTIICIFGDGNSCPLKEFVTGSCGYEYLKNPPCVEKGGVILPYLEAECCEGKPYIKPMSLGYKHCRSYSYIVGSTLLYSPIMWLIYLILLILIIVLVVKKRKKK